MILAAAAFNCPLVGIADNDPHTAHRVNLDGLPIKTWETATHATAQCGTPVKLIELRWQNLRTRGTPVHRCRECRA
jgi:hypothetical protein